MSDLREIGRGIPCYPRVEIVAKEPELDQTPTKFISIMAASLIALLLWFGPGVFSDIRRDSQRRRDAWNALPEAEKEIERRIQRERYKAYLQGVMNSPLQP